MKIHSCILTFTHQQKCCFSWTKLHLLNEDQKMHKIFVFTVVENETLLLIFAKLFVSTDFT